MKSHKNKTDDVKSTSIIQDTPEWLPQPDMAHELHQNDVGSYQPHNNKFIDR